MKIMLVIIIIFLFSCRRRHTRLQGDWSSDVCSSDLTENYQHFVENAYVLAAREPRSTFSASVDTAAYSILRSKITSGQQIGRASCRERVQIKVDDFRLKI